MAILFVPPLYAHQHYNRRKTMVYMGLQGVMVI
jgi:hypothetical protein